MIISTFYLCLLAVVLFHSIFFSLVLKVHREAALEETGHRLELKISGHI
jgi:hypothetical protein